MNQTPFTRSALFGPTAKNDGLTAAEEAHKKKQSVKRHAKRKKPRWRDRISPATESNDADEPKDDIIDEATLTRCTRCPTHRSRTGRFRPLIGNGECVCDDCYQREFPATAMLDDVNQNELQRMGKRASNFLRNKITDNVADIMGATHETPDDAIQRSNEKNNEYPSEVECRMCLERAVFRRCCSAYYCHSCYYKAGRCPGCEIETPLTGIAAADLKPDPGKVAVGISYAISLLLTFITAVGLALAYFNASTAPATVWGHTCRGWFPVCDLQVCIDYDGGIGYGEGGEFLPAAQPYRVCDRSSSAKQVVGSACVYDRELYGWSNQLLGYDICISSPREENSRPRNVSSPDPLLLFSGSQDGVYIFDADFELPLKNETAPWPEIVNGNRSSVCGVNSQVPERGNHGGFQPVRNKNALVFTGVHTRHATTVGLNIQHGGRVEFYLKMGPIDTDGSTSECKTAFSDVTLEYSTTSDDGWKTFGTYPAWKYRGQEFQFISQVIPADASSNATHFRFRQASFDVLRDHWAIDDVRIFANLKSEWQETVGFGERKEQQDGDTLFAQCCYNTEMCSVFDKKRTNFDYRLCERIPGFNTSQISSRLKFSELLILYLCLAAGAKVLYRLVVLRFVRRVSSTKKESFNDTTGSGQSQDTDLFPRHSFYSISHLSWQYALASILFVALAGTVYRLLGALMVFKCLSSDRAGDISCKTDTSFIFACFFAVSFDLRAIGMLLGEVFCIQNPLKRKSIQVVVDLHPERGFMRVGSKTVPLSEVSDIKRQSSLFYCFISSCYMFGGMPFALGSLTVQSFDLPNGLEVCAPILGCVALLRVIFGPSVFVKISLTIEWVLTLKQQDRDELGRSVLRKGLLQQFISGSILTPVVIMFSLLSRRVEDVSAGDNFLLFLVCAGFGGLFGVLIGIMHGLPVVPGLSKLTGWPRTCFSVSYYDRVNCSCLFSCTYCGEIHSRQMLMVIALDDPFAFKKMLLGNRPSAIISKP
ncbi:hypothetical protein ACHAXR_005758 [Thalassiosira sp. AJA248-18]